jgi:glycine/D-amino acid oxidase-like deaminating enzyme
MTPYMSSLHQCDVAVIGGGFYGCFIAAFFAERGSRVILCERDDELLTRASYGNQARVHNGYHYPRSLVTAARSHENFAIFTEDFRDCIDDAFTKVYAIAAQHSKVNAFQFTRLCKVIGAPVKRAKPEIRKLFNLDLIEEVFEVTEFAFDAIKLREVMRRRMAKAGVVARCGTEVRSIRGASPRMRLETGDGGEIEAKQVFNCTYAAINSVLDTAQGGVVPLKKELAEIALVRVPEQLASLGITVMDGPFFSVMPFPAAGVHSLTHVRYTPVASWIESDGPKAGIEGGVESRWRYMVKDAARYLPAIMESQYVKSLFETKALLPKNELDDGRPIMMQESGQCPGLWTVLGAKIDNIYDVRDAIAERFRVTATAAGGAR